MSLLLTSNLFAQSGNIIVNGNFETLPDIDTDKVNENYKIIAPGWISGNSKVTGEEKYEGLFSLKLPFSADMIGAGSGAENYIKAHEIKAGDEIELSAASKIVGIPGKYFIANIILVFSYQNGNVIDQLKVKLNTNKSMEWNKVSGKITVPSAWNSVNCNVKCIVGTWNQTYPASEGAVYVDDILIRIMPKTTQK